MIAKFSVQKPYTVLVGVILVLVLGVVSITRMVTDLLPEMSFPYVLVITTDPGASPETVEMEVTAPIEAAMSSTSNIKSINSVSNNSYSMVILEYEQDTNMDSTIIEIQQNLDVLKSSWNNDNIGSPIITQIDPDMIPVMAVAVSKDNMDSIELSKYVQDELEPAMESIEGVGSVNTSGLLENAITITLNEEKIKTLNDKIESSINKEFDKAKKEVEDGSAQIEDATNKMNEGSTQLSDALTQTLQKQSELYSTREDLNKQLSDLKSQKESLTGIQTALKSFVDSSEYANLQSLEAAIEANPAAADALQAQLDAANKAIAAQFAPLSAMGISVNTYKDVPIALSKVSETLAQINAGISAIESGLSQLDTGEATLNQVLTTLNANASLAALQMSASASTLATASASLSSAKASIDSAQTQALDAADLNSVLSIDTVSGLLMAQNFNMPAGFVLDGDVSYMLRAGNEADSIEEYENMTLIDMGLDDLGPITLSDVADIKLDQRGNQTYAVINGKTGILLSLFKQTGYSTGEVTNRAIDSFDTMMEEDEGLDITVLMDQGVYISIIVKGVIQNVLMGAILAVLVLLVFLRSMRPTIIIACAIPLSVLTAIVLMYFTGLTLNMISMSGLAMGIGMLVDNSIVVVENIFRLRQKDIPIKEAAIQGTNQVIGAITASTLTTVSVYAPIIFTSGVTRQLFVDIALTILFTLGASLVVAMTLVPAMAKTTLSKYEIKENKSHTALLDIYEKILRWSLSHKAVVIIVSLVLLIVTTFASLARGLNFLDMEVEADQISMSISAPEGKELEFEELTALGDETLERLYKIDGIETVGAAAGSGSGGATSMFSSSNSITVYLLLDPDRKKSVEEISDEIVEATKDIDAKIEVSSSSMDYTQMFGSGLSIEISGSSIDKIRELATEVAKIVEETPGTQNVDDGLNNSQPEFRITVDRDKAAKYGYTVAQVYQLIAAEISDASPVAKLKTDSDEFEVYLQTEEQSKVSLDDIKKLTFTYVDKKDENKEKEIAIADICEFEETETLASIRRKAQTRFLTVSSEIAEGYNVTLVSSEISDKIEKLDIPNGYNIEMTGEDETINDAMRQMVLMMILAVIFIYLIMVAQFQSLRSPFIIMFTIPVAFTGGFLALLITGIELNVIAMLGLVMLSGLIVNNGIVLIDYINKAREEGMEKREAIVESGKVRLRPIFMTVLTTVLSMSTIALGIGRGTEMMQPMAITLIGGLVYGTVLTLVVVPCVYEIFHFRQE